MCALTDEEQVECKGKQVVETDGRGTDGPFSFSILLSTCLHRAMPLAGRVVGGVGMVGCQIEECYEPLLRFSLKLFGVRLDLPTGLCPTPPLRVRRV